MALSVNLLSLYRGDVGILWGFIMLIPPTINIFKNDQQQRPKCYGYIGHVKYTGTNGSNAQIEKICNLEFIE
jgi:hypothetical protein